MAKTILRFAAALALADISFGGGKGRPVLISDCITEPKAGYEEVQPAGHPTKVYAPISTKVIKEPVKMYTKAIDGSYMYDGLKGRGKPPANRSKVQVDTLVMIDGKQVNLKDQWLRIEAVPAAAPATV